jgi:hypothetical protein
MTLVDRKTKNPDQKSSRIGSYILLFLVVSRRWIGYLHRV